MLTAEFMTRFSFESFVWIVWHLRIDWLTAIGLEPGAYGTHSHQRTKAAEIYRKT